MGKLCKPSCAPTQQDLFRKEKTHKRIPSEARKGTWPRNQVGRMLGKAAQWRAVAGASPPRAQLMFSYCQRPAEVRKRPGRELALCHVKPAGSFRPPWTVSRFSRPLLFFNSPVQLSEGHDRLNLSLCSRFRVSRGLLYLPLFLSHFSSKEFGMAYVDSLHALFILTTTLLSMQVESQSE